MKLPACPECRALFEADVNLWNRTRTNEVRHGSWVAETRMLEELAVTIPPLSNPGNTGEGQCGNADSADSGKGGDPPLAGAEPPLARSRRGAS